MWFEILPSAGVVFLALSFPHFAAYYLNKLALGNEYRRTLLSRNDRTQYLRDLRLTNNPYILSGLDSIPDK